MKRFFSAVRVAALFVGSVVGAGFATGQEIALFFAGGDVLTHLFSALFMGGSCLVFMEAGALLRRGESIVNALVALSSFVVYAAMIAAAEDILSSLFSVRGLSFLLAAGSAALSLRDIGKLSLLNVIAVPLIAVMVICVGARGASLTGGQFRPLSALAYGAMNTLFSGALMAKEGEKMSRGERILCGVTVSALLFLLLFFMSRAVRGNEGAMPFLSAAKKTGAELSAPITLLLAIITTMTSCNYLITQEMRPLTKDGFLAAALPLLAGLLLAAWGFQNVVTYLYPAVSALALGYSLLVFFLFGREKLSRFPIRLRPFPRRE